MLFTRVLRCVLFAAFGLLLTASWQADAADWNRFRGPDGSGVSDEKPAPPTTWSATENLLWKADLPGAGVSSPIVVGDRVFVTCYSGYGLDRTQPGDIKDLKRHLVCFDKQAGAELWRATVDAALPEDPYAGIGVTAHGYASHTPVSDGERVFAFFGKSGVYAYDLEGKELWNVSVGGGSDPWEWGSSSSPIVCNGKVIVTASAESESVVALDAATGKEAWRQEAGTLAGMWGTPILVDAGEGKSELVMSVPGEIWGLNPESGKLRWYCLASNADQAHTSAVSANGMIYAITGRGGAATAVLPGGKGDVTESHIVWTGDQTSRFGTPIGYQGKLYLIANGSIRTIDAFTGEQLGQQRLSSQGGQQPAAPEADGRGRRGRSRSLDYASPIIAGGRLYYVNGRGETFVFAVDGELEQLAVNRVGDGGESFGGTPAVSEGRLYLRSDKALYCVANK